jgi:hypothetical protein
MSFTLARKKKNRMASSASYLSTGKVNLLELKEWLRREFLSFFETYNGKKLIVWDNQLTIPIGLISEYSVLKVKLLATLFT